MIQNKTLTDEISAQVTDYSSSPLNANFQFKKKKKAWYMAKSQVSIQETDKSSSSVIHLTFSFSLWLAILLRLDLF